MLKALWKNRTILERILLVTNILSVCVFFYVVNNYWWDNFILKMKNYLWELYITLMYSSIIVIVCFVILIAVLTFMFRRKEDKSEELNTL